MSIASDYSTIPMTIHAALFSPSFLWKEVPRRGGGWPRETVLPHSGKPTPPRFARLPLPEEGARMIFKETLIQSLSFAVSDSRFPHICRALLRFPHLSFIPPVPYPPLWGTFPSRGRLAIQGKPAINRLSGIAPYICGEAATFTPHSSLLTLHSSLEQNFHSQSKEQHIPPANPPP